ncbi:MAG: hypothetical protein E4H20_04400 [Spirochaetales bacterium]|nr:MAG: hypothetical protein E4H20_04400 [Spirochaetales bacterium]
MKNKRALLIIVLTGAVVIMAVAVFIAISLGNSQGARSNLLSSYFKALSERDTTLMEDLTTVGFSSDLPLDGLTPKTYSLYSFGQRGEPPAQRFALIVTNPDGSETVYLADMFFAQRGLNREVDAIRLIERGTGIKE